MALEYKRLIRFKLKKEKSDFESITITCSSDSAKCIKAFYDDDIEIYESAFLLLLSRSNNTIGYVKISQGGISGTFVDLKLIAKYALESLASSVIFAHNHPSGSKEPSNIDIDLSNKLKKGLKLLDINLLDSIILTKNSYYSLLDNGDI